MAINTKNKKIHGATLIESLTALAIVSTVMASAFTLYEKTVSGEQQVMRTRVKHLQMAAENMLERPDAIGELSDDFISVSAEVNVYAGQNDIKQITCTFTTKNGKMIAEKNYICYQP